MKLNEIRDNQGATHAKKRLGRGIGSGLGKTAGKGHKGQKARSGGGDRSFEGGQQPITRRVPKRGFNNIFALDFQEINLGGLQTAVDAGKIDVSQPVTKESLVAAGVIRRPKDGIRLLGKGILTASLTIHAAGASKSATAAVEKAGGKIIVKAPKVVEPKGAGKAKRGLGKGAGKGAGKSEGASA